MKKYNLNYIIVIIFNYTRACARNYTLINLNYDLLLSKFWETKECSYQITCSLSYPKMEVEKVWTFEICKVSWTYKRRVPIFLFHSSQ